MQLLTENLLKNKMDVYMMRKKMIRKKDPKFQIKSGIIRKQRSYSHRQRAHIKHLHEKSTANLNFRPERNQRELRILLQSKSEKMYRTTDELVNIGKRLKKKEKKELLLKLIDEIELTDMSQPYSIRKKQVSASLKILKEIQSSESIYKDFVNIIVRVLNDFLQVNYTYYLDNFMSNESLKTVFKKVYAVDSDTHGTSFHSSFLERFLVALNLRFNQYETIVKEKTIRIQGLTGKLEEETSKNYEITLQQEIKKLKREIDGLLNEKEMMIAEEENYNSKIYKMQEKINDLRYVYNDTLDFNEKLSNKLEEKGKELEACNKRRELLEQTIRHYKENKMDNIEQIIGVKFKAKEMSLILKKFKDKIGSLVEENKELQTENERIEYKNDLGYEDLTPRPDYNEIFQRRRFDFKRDVFGMKIEKETISTKEVIEKLLDQIFLYESERNIFSRQRKQRTQRHQRRKSFRKPNKNRSKSRYGGKNSNMGSNNSSRARASPRIRRQKSRKYGNKPSNFLQATKMRNKTFNPDDTKQKSGSPRLSHIMKNFSEAANEIKLIRRDADSPKIMLNSKDKLQRDQDTDSPRILGNLIPSIQDVKSEAPNSDSSEEDTNKNFNQSINIARHSNRENTSEFTEIKLLDDDMSSIHNNLDLLLGCRDKS